MSQICSRPTYLNRNGVPESLLDLVFTNASDLFDAPAQVFPPISSSDHLPVVVHCTLSCRFSCPPTIDQVCWQYHLKDQNRMSNAFLFENWAHVFDTNDIDNVWTKWKEQFFPEVADFIPFVVYTKRQTTQSKFPPWLNKEVRQLVRAKNRLFDRACNSKQLAHWKVYRVARNRASGLRRLKQHSSIDKLIF